MSEPPSAPDEDAARAITLAARAHERDRYLTALLAPRTAKADLIAIAAAMGEIGRIPVFVSEPMIGEIRLQWWRDTITNAEAGLRSGNPIADALTDVMRRHGLASGLVMGLIDSQSLLFYPELPEDEMALHQHLARFHGAGFELAARILGAQVEGETVTILNEAGVVYGRARTALEAGAVAAQGRTLFPADQLRPAGLAADRLGAPDYRAAAARLVRAFCDETLRRLETIRPQMALMPAPVRQVCRPLAMVQPYCACVTRSGETVFDSAPDVMPLTRVWRIWRGC